MSVESPVQKLSPDNQREDLAFVTCGDFSGTLTVCFSLFTAIAITNCDHQMGLMHLVFFIVLRGKKNPTWFPCVSLCMAPFTENEDSLK